MKKFLAVILVIALALSLAACGSSSSSAPAGDSGSSAAPSSSSSSSTASTTIPADAGGTAGSTKATPNCNEDGTPNLDKIAHFDPEFDYSINKGLKLAYIAEDSGPLYQETSDACELWCAKYGIEWVGFSCSNMDMEKFMSLLQNFIDQGVQLFVLDPDSATLETVSKFMDKYPEVSWISHMSGPRNSAKEMIAPYLGFDQEDAGYQQMIRLDQWRQENIPDVDWSEIGLLDFDYSSSFQLHLRVDGVARALNDLGITDKVNRYTADCVATGLSMQGGIDAASPIIATNSYKYWLVAGGIDDWALGAANILEQQGLTDTSCVVAFGGSGAISQWDAGQSNAYRYALFCSNSLYAEPTIGALIAYHHGWATPATIWPSWINYNDCGGEGGTYATLLMPLVWLDEGNYKEYVEWTDLYCGGNRYHYEDQVSITMDSYTSIVEDVPSTYAKQ